MRELPGLLLLIPLGCVSEKGPTDPAPDDGDDPPAEPACTVDEDCGTTEICEEDVCVVGDRDNTFDEATPILQSEERSGVIAPAGDVDTWAYTSLGPEWLRIETTTVDDPVDNLDTVVQVFAANGAEHAVMDNYPTGRVSTYDTVLYVYLPRADTWYVTVEDVTTHYDASFTENEWRGGTDFTYTLSLEGTGAVTSEDDSFEAPSQLVEISSRTSIWAVGVNLETAGDSDWIEVELPFEGQPLDVFGHSAIPGSPARARVRLYDPTGELVSEKDDLGDDGQLSYFEPVAGTWTLEATDVDGQGSDEHWYVVYVRTYDEGASHPAFGTGVYETELEPNDSDADATPMPLLDLETGGYPYQAQYVQGTLDAPGDEDWYVVATAPYEKVSARCFSESYGSLTELDVRLFDGSSDITPVDQGVPTDFWYYLHNIEVDPGEYHVQILSANGASGPGAYYRCRILQAPFDFLVE